MLKITDNKKYWTEIFKQAKHGHTLWDVRYENPHDPSLAYTTAYDFLHEAVYRGMFSEGNKILDIGCGNGRFGIPFSQMDVDYEGIEPMKECVDFCNMAFKDYPHLKFRHTPVQSKGYGLSGIVKKEDFTLPYPNDYFDDVIAYSVFTHLETIECACNYINEINRVIKPSGKLFITWYRSTNNVVDSNPFRTVYCEKDIINMMNGYKFIFTYGGHSPDFYDQWGIFAEKT